MNTKDYFIKHFKKLKIKKNDNICLYVAVAPFGIYKKDLFKVIIDTLLKTLGPKGTLIMPCYNFNFNRKKIYDVKKVHKIKNNDIYNFFFNNYKKYQSPSLIHGHCGVGKKANLLDKTNMNQSFGKNSDFELFYKNKFNLLMLGCGASHGATYFHHLEKLINVNYRKNIFLKFKIKNASKSFKEINYNYFARKNNNFVENFDGFFENLKLKKNIVNIRYGNSYYVSIASLHKVSMRVLKKNKSALIKNVVN